MFDLFQTLAVLWDVVFFLLGWFPDVWIVDTDVSKHPVCSTLLKGQQIRSDAGGITQKEIMQDIWCLITK
jgi:hypothetical protein